MREGKNGMATPWTEIVTVTPERAKELLATQIPGSNRPLSKFWLDKYAGVMKSGEWKLNGQRVLMDGDGHLFDGQHRLTAIVMTGISVPMEIGHGYDRAAFDTLDCGFRRSAGDVLSMKGYKEGRKLAAAALMVYAHKQESRDMPNRVSHHKILEIVEANPLIHHSIALCIGMPRGFPVGVLAAMHCLAAEVDQDAADQFINAVKTGANLEHNDPALLLRNRIIRRRISSTAERWDLLVVGLRAFDAYRQGQPMSRLQSPKGMGVNKEFLIRQERDRAGRTP